MFYGRYNDLVSNYNVSVRHMLAEVLHTCKTIIYNVATTPMHLIPFCLLFFFSCCPAFDVSFGICF